MRNSISIVLVFIAGALIARLDISWLNTIGHDGTLWVLYTLMFLVGISLGSDKSMSAQLKTMSPRVLLVPAATILGTLAGAALISLIVPGRNMTECLMVGSGFAYYSLSSVLITQTHGAALGTVALMSNIFRELATLLFAPWMVKRFGPLAPISSGGATTMDTTLPIIIRYSGKDFIFVSVVHGMIVDFSTPVLVTLFSMI